MRLTRWRERCKEEGVHSRDREKASQSLKEQKAISAGLDSLCAETRRLESVYQRKLRLLSDTYAIMSDMASDRITIRIPETLGQRLRHRSRMRGQPESALVREALETYLGQTPEPRPAYELAEEAGLIGCIGRGPKSPAKDLSTNPRHFEGFGKDK